MFIKLKAIIISLLLIILTTTNVVQAMPVARQKEYYGPKVGELKGKEDIIKNLEEIKRIRANLVAVDISENVTDQELKEINKNLDYYLIQINAVIKNLEGHKVYYKDSFPDLFLSEQIIFIADSFILSIRQLQILTKQLEGVNKEARKLFYSNYLIPVYYYLTLGDQMIAYIDKYFVIP